MNLTAGDHDSLGVIRRIPVTAFLFRLTVGSHGHLAKSLFQFLLFLLGETGTRIFSLFDNEPLLSVSGKVPRSAINGLFNLLYHILKGMQ